MLLGASRQIVAVSCAMTEGPGEPRVDTVLLEDPVTFWDRRHATQDELRSGGDIGIDTAANEIFYAVRLGQLLQMVGDGTDASAPLRILDAGCGKGYFSEALTRCGHEVVAVDSSPTAIEQARTTGSSRYEVATLDVFRDPFLFDVVYSIDVLFHILDDVVWEASLRNLAAHVRLAGKLILTDRDHAERAVLGDYIVHRATDEYASRLERWGFAPRGFTPYDFRLNTIGFHVFERIS